MRAHLDRRAVFYLAGILASAMLAAELGSAALVGMAAAHRYLGFDGHPTTLYVRADTAHRLGGHLGVVVAGAVPLWPHWVL